MARVVRMLRWSSTIRIFGMTENESVVLRARSYPVADTDNVGLAEHEGGRALRHGADHGSIFEVSQRADQIRHARRRLVRGGEQLGLPHDSRVASVLVGGWAHES